MKKLIFSGILISGLFAGFLPNKTYNCETIGVSFKDKNQTINIPNNFQTKKGLKQTLKNLYSISFKIKGKYLSIKAGNANDTMVYVKKFKSLDVYTTRDHQAFLFLDSNHTQAGLNLPSQKTMIYYQCK